MASAKHSNTTVTQWAAEERRLAIAKWFHVYAKTKLLNAPGADCCDKAISRAIEGLKILLSLFNGRFHGGGSVETRINEEYHSNSLQNSVDASRVTPTLLCPQSNQFRRLSSFQIQIKVWERQLHNREWRGVTWRQVSVISVWAGINVSFGKGQIGISEAAAALNYAPLGLNKKNLPHKPPRKGNSRGLDVCKMSCQSQAEKLDMQMHDKVRYCHEQDSLRRSYPSAQTTRLVHKKFIAAIILIASEEIQLNSCAVICHPAWKKPMRE